MNMKHATYTLDSDIITLTMDMDFDHLQRHVSYRDYQELTNILLSILREGLASLAEYNIMGNMIFDGMTGAA